MKSNAALSKSLKGVYLVPGLPHILKPEMNKGYKALADGFEAVRKSLLEHKVERILYYSTQWISVLGQSYQAKADLKGFHVDENWYELDDLLFDFKVDKAFAQAMATEATAAGMPTALVECEGFPVDTGTIVADRFLNHSHRPVGMISSWVYADHEKTKQIASTVRKAIEASGVATAVVGVSLLSGNYFTTEIDLREDRIREAADDDWNRRILKHWEAGEHTQANALLGEYAQATKADMGLKAYSFLEGIAKEAKEPWNRAAICHAYAPIYGAGAAVVEF